MPIAGLALEWLILTLTYPDSYAVTMTHDGVNRQEGDGNRVKQVAGTSTYTFSYQGLNVLYEKNVTGGTTTVTKHFYANGLQVAKIVGSTVYYLYQDALGSTRLVATASVTIKFSSNYVPYGNNYGISGKEVFMYTGKTEDWAKMKEPWKDETRIEPVRASSNSTIWN